MVGFDHYLPIKRYQIPKSKNTVSATDCTRIKLRQASKWEVTEKQAVIRTPTEALLKLGVIEESRATEGSQVHLVPKPIPNEWRFTLDFVRLNACTGGLEGWPIPNILKVLERIGTLKPRLFGLIDFTTGYHQTPLHPNSRDLSAFITADGLYRWTQVTMGLKGAGPYFQRSMARTLFPGGHRNPDSPNGRVRLRHRRSRVHGNEWQGTGEKECYAIYFGVNNSRISSITGTLF